MAGMQHDTGATADARFVAWMQGRTGYPAVDAAMLQLEREGWMHNRMRMVVASFLVKDLHLEWTRGARYFMSMLRDGDLASNNHGWQWVAGSGTDPAPYFRIFNPVTQGRKFDPDGQYVRTYVAELAEVPGGAVHEPWTLSAGCLPAIPSASSSTTPSVKRHCGAMRPFGVRARECPTTPTRTRPARGRRDPSRVEGVSRAGNRLDRYGPPPPVRRQRVAGEDLQVAERPVTPQSGAAAVLCGQCHRRETVRAALHVGVRRVDVQVADPAWLAEVVRRRPSRRVRKR